MDLGGLSKCFLSSGEMRKIRIYQVWGCFSPLCIFSPPIHPFYAQVKMNGTHSQVALVVKNPPTNAGDTRDIRSPGVGNGNPLQYSCLENPMHRGAWLAIVYRVIKSRTWLKWLSMYSLHISIIYIHMIIMYNISPFRRGKNQKRWILP